MNRQLQLYYRFQAETIASRRRQIEEMLRLRFGVNC